ncbi:ABC transporter permease [Algoriphagus sp. AGSA1]|uniref:ABC transporter permease n=1 Tax=Algoriphagus sp. AGSA1 TaxID=2907213 RepID=UPI001F45A5A5|nr:ABC transporter permease [Algoriphagus sp. AGSA1]MCE7057448.1 ABC transporter permease [Algoriphagus sp. AGSA1]
MWNNYLKIAWRALLKDRTYSLINILGLTVGIASCMLIGTVVLDELSYDSFWKHKHNLYRILQVDTTAGVEGKIESAYMNLGNELKENFPEVKVAGKVTKAGYRFRLKETDKGSIQMNLIQADTNVWEMLDFHVLEGVPRQYVAGIGNLVVSESFSADYFEGESPVGKIIYSVSPYQDEARPFLITGVIADIPSNSYLRADGMQVTLPSSRVLSREGWGFYEEQLILMEPHADMGAFEVKVNHWYRDFITEASDETKKRVPVYEFQPVQEIYLHSDFASQPIKGKLGNVYIFSGIAVLLLLIASINFVNLSAARAVRRIRETGVRKVLGAGRKQLVIQILCESLLFFLIASIFASVLYALSLAQMESFLGHKLEVNLLGNGLLLLICIQGAILLGVLAGAYPAWMVSGFAVGNSLKNRFGSQMSSSVPVIRRALVTTQFFFALLVLIGTLTVWSQMRFLEEKELGYDPSRVLSISFFSTGGKESSLKQQITQMSGVENVSLSSWIPTQGAASMTKQVNHPENPDQSIAVNYIIGDSDLPLVLGFHLTEGRLFDIREDNDKFDPNALLEEVQVEKTTEVQATALMTASTSRLLGVTELGVYRADLGIKTIGIIEDFHSTSLRDPIKPTVLLRSNEMSYASLLIKVREGSEAGILRDLTRIWSQFYPEKPMEYNWLDELVNGQYEKEKMQAQLFSFFAVLMLFLAALGVFGLVVHTTEQRIKEIGVRKVLGASLGNILYLFTLDYMMLVAIGLLIASPLAWYGMNRWLEGFAYRISLQWWMFVGAGAIALAVTLFTVGVQVWRSASINPAHSLRSE